MCLALPGKIIKIKNNKAIVDFGEHQHEAKLDLIKNLKLGDYVYMHGGFVLDKISKKEAEENDWFKIRS
ncbi:MAG: HypC/HybG/HupF family hydrogenase formation chaperone [bacterium]